MLQGVVNTSWFYLSCCLLLGLCSPGEDAGSSLPFFEREPGELDLEDLEWGSGSSLLHLLQHFPADSPFVTENMKKPANCSQRFWLPPSSPICWENIAGPEEFAKSRLLVLQNRAYLQAVSTSSGVEDSGFSYDQQAREEVEGIRSDYKNMVETMQTMDTVFESLQEKRKEGSEQRFFMSMREHLASTRGAIDGREHTLSDLEKQISSLEKMLLNAQLRLTKLIQQ
ncbi:uncharacterized protein LOC114472114 [Gouania willdenowi]|uniref:uncharacterized protein LOC114472114 n=1 Tax=Gouania willdenowi TaxID=441366 RepID=UPI0010559094|nr:uncharacterized protein LOC114472114 [Gouania willdenowi]